MIRLALSAIDDTISQFYRINNFRGGTMESLELMPARVKITSIIKKAIYSGEYKSVSGEAKPGTTLSTA